MSQLINATGTNQKSFSLGVGTDKVELTTIDGVLYFRNSAEAWQQVASTGAITSVTVNSWAPLTQYFTGQLVRYQGVLFIVKSNHSSSASIETDSAFLRKIEDFDAAITIDVDSASSPRQLEFFDPTTIVCEGTTTGSFEVRLPVLANVSPGQEFRIYNKSNSTITVASSTGSGIQSLAASEISSFTRNTTADWVSARIQEVSETQQSGTSVPTGAIIAWPHEVVPVGWLQCDGSSHFKVDFPTLYNTIGGRFGSTDTAFNIPDLRGRVIRGWDNGAGVDTHAGDRLDRGDGTDGDAIGTIQNCYLIDHEHLHSFNDPGHVHTTGSIAVQFFSVIPGPGAHDNGAAAGGSGSSVNDNSTGISMDILGVDPSSLSTVDLSSTEINVKNMNMMWIIKT